MGPLGGQARVVGDEARRHRRQDQREDQREPERRSAAASPTPPMATAAQSAMTFSAATVARRSSHPAVEDGGARRGRPDAARQIAQRLGTPPHRDVVSGEITGGEHGPPASQEEPPPEHGGERDGQRPPGELGKFDVPGRAHAHDDHDRHRRREGDRPQRGNSGRRPARAPRAASTHGLSALLTPGSPTEAVSRARRGALATTCPGRRARTGSRRAGSSLLAIAARALVVHDRALRRRGSPGRSRRSAVPKSGTGPAPDEPSLSPPPAWRAARSRCPSRGRRVSRRTSRAKKCTPR